MFKMFFIFHINRIAPLAHRTAFIYYTDYYPKIVVFIRVFPPPDIEPVTSRLSIVIYGFGLDSIELN